MRAGEIRFSIVTAALAFMLPCVPAAAAAAPADAQIKVAPAFDAKQFMEQML